MFSQGIRPMYNGNNYVTIQAGATLDQIIEKAAEVTPSSNQLDWQRLEFIAFIHFGINTSTGTTVGNKRLLQFPFVTTQKVRFITDA